MPKISLDCRYLSVKAFDTLCQEIGLSGGTIDSAFGPILLRFLGDSLCGLGFEKSAFLKKKQPLLLFETAFQDNPQRCRHLMDSMETGKTIPTLLAGTPFQHQVWQHLQTLPSGKTICYQELAQQMGDVKKTRAVASALARNPISWFIPCHRVLPKNKGIGHYLWGHALKEKLLQAEGVCL